MEQILLYIIFSGFLCCFFHEFCHWSMAAIFDKNINFTLSFKYKLFNVIPIPRGIWYMPEGLSRTKEKLIAGAGFGGEFLLILGLYFIEAPILKYYIVLAIIHFVAYFFYAGDASDFKWFKDK